MAVADSLFTVELERSLFFLDNNGTPYPITSGATLELTDMTTGLVYTTNETDTLGRYILPAVAIAGHSYFLKVTHPEYGEVTAETTVPVPVEIMTMDTVIYNSDNGVRVMATITFQDVWDKKLLRFGGYPTRQYDPFLLLR